MSATRPFCFLSFRLASRATFIAIAIAFCSSGWAQSEKSPASSVVQVTPAVPKIVNEPSALPPAWQAGTAYPEAVKRYGFAQNGEDLYVISGDTVGGGFTSALRRFNATTNIWTSLAPIPNPSEGPVAAFLGGKIYVADGFSFGGGFRIYNVANNTWSTGLTRPGVNDSFGAAAGAFNGKVFIVGGSSGNFNSTVLSIYDVASSTWSVGPSALSPFYLGGYAQSGQYLYLAGSLTTTSGVISTVTQRLDMATNTWSTGPNWTTPRGQCALVVAGTKLIAMGGDTNGSGAPSAQVDELDITAWPGGTWVSSPDNLPSPRSQYSAGFVSTGRSGGEIWSTGGEGPGGILKEHLYRAAPTCLTYLLGAGAGTIVPGTVDTGNHGDDVSTVVALPFSYRLYDQAFSSVTVGSNGHLTFGVVNNAFDPTCIPVAGATYAIGAYWTDQCTGACTGVSGAGLGIFTSITGSAPNRIFNIEWRTAYYNSGGAGVPLNYEVRLYESQAIFDVIYGTVNTFNPPQARKLSAGVQKDGAQFTLQGCDPTGGTAPPVTAGFRLRYTLTSTACAPLPAPTGFLYALNTDSTGNQIYGFSVNETTGALTALAGFPIMTGGNDSSASHFDLLGLDSTNQRLFAINDGSNTLSAYQINPSSGGLAPMPFSPVALPASERTTIAVHPSGSPLILGGRNATPLVDSLVITPTSATPAAGSPYSTGAIAPLSSILSRDGNFYYESGRITSGIGGYSVNPATGVLTTLSGSPFPSADIATANATDSTGRLFVANRNNTLQAFTTAAGIPTGVTGNPFPLGLTSGDDGVLHPNEQFYYVADTSGNRFGGYRIGGSGAATTLTPITGLPVTSSGTLPGGVVVNQTGAFLFGANSASRNLIKYDVNSTTGALSNPVAQAADSLGASGRVVGLAYTNASMVRTAVSRKTHGAAGVFDVNLPLAGAPGVECRLGSGAGDDEHQIVVAFAAPVSVPTLGVSGTIGGGSNFGVNANVVTVNLVGVANAQTVTLFFSGVTDGVNTGTVVLPIAFLAGDTNASRSVSATDIGQTKSLSGQPLTGVNFRSDLNVGGSINASDVSLVKSRSGTFLPPLP